MSEPWYVWPNPMRSDGAFIAVGLPILPGSPPPSLLDWQIPHADAEAIVALRNEHPVLARVFDALLAERKEIIADACREFRPWSTLVAPAPFPDACGSCGRPRERCKGKQP